MSVKPVVDGIEQALAGKLDVVRLNIQEPVGRELAAAFGASFTPTFVLFDENGNEVWRSVFQIDRGTVEQALLR